MGIVHSIGENVTEFVAGQRVCFSCSGIQIIYD
jgi:NADPH:quinone reductase-like Zn-dependent oxidoreductase